MFFQFIVAVLLVTLTSAFSPAQYCRVDEELGVDFCASITSFANVSSTNADVYIRISSRFRSKNGWSAIGTGETMAGALMFVFYPSANGDEATVSLRTAKGHYPPKVVSDAPEYRVLDVTVHNDYYDITVVCYSCNLWTGSRISVDSRKQSFIYSAQVSQKMRTSDLNAALQLHTDYRSFEIDMTRIHFTDELLLPTFMNNGRETAGLRNISPPIAWHTYHGTAMLVTFSILMPSAITYMRSSMPYAFTVHWVMQLTGALLAITSAAFATAKSWGTLEASPKSILNQHIYFGVLITLLLVIQPVLGYFHHILYIQFKRRTKISYAHIWIGRILMMLAWVNTALGYKLAHVGAMYVTWWFVLLGGMACAMIWAPAAAEKVRRLKEETGGPAYEPLTLDM